MCECDVCNGASALPRQEKESCVEHFGNGSDDEQAQPQPNFTPGSGEARKGLANMGQQVLGNSLTTVEDPDPTWAGSAVCDDLDRCIGWREVESVLNEMQQQGTQEFFISPNGRFRFEVDVQPVAERSDVGMAKDVR